MTPSGAGVRGIPSHVSPEFRPAPGGGRCQDRARLVVLYMQGMPHAGSTASLSCNDESSVHIIALTVMPRRPPEDAKAAALRAAGALHPQPERVQDPAFAAHPFFDRRDRVQVKYEMLRRHRLDGRPVTAVATSFGVSRQAFYQADHALTAGGLPGLLPRKRGPQRGHKCTDAVLDFVAQRRAQGAARGAAEAAAVARRFGVTIHPRSLDRALARREKKRRRLEAPRP